MDELQALKQWAKGRRHAPIEGRSRGPLVLLEYWNAAEADLDRAIAIAESYFSAGQQAMKELSHLAGGLEGQLAHLLAWDAWFVKIVDMFIEQGKERSQARADVLELRNVLIIASAALKAAGQADLSLRILLADTEHYEQVDKSSWTM